MSLSWRKRQAQASDQKSWRALGTDSALWKGIDKNAGNVKTALGGAAATTEGIVTGLKFVKTENGASFATQNSAIITVSDPSNAAVAGTLGINLFSTPYDASMNCSGKGLVFNVQNFTSITSGTPNTLLNQDISGQKITILSGGSGYNVGETFSMDGAPYGSSGVMGVITSVASAKIEPGRN